MRDLTTPPFRTGDVAYTRPAPGGFASAAAVPVDPAYAGADVAFTAPSLGGEFQPGSGTPSPTGAPTSKGADADGGALDLKNTPRAAGSPAPAAPATIAQLSGTVSSPFVVFAGKATKVGTVGVTFTDPVAGTPLTIVTNVAIGDTAGMIAAKVAVRLNENGKAEATQTSNAVQVLKADGKPVAALAVVITLP